ncbi:MAG TPA: hypothetical protein VGG62_17875 [Terracidiphilus sp.]
MEDQSEGWIREASPAIDNKAILQQLDRMLKSRHFRSSRRYPAFLAHIVRRRLEGDLDSLKERILGIEVFKRSHDYDTGADPVVRITAGEVRKRIALYYHDEGTEQELRIELPAGSYVPVFFPFPSSIAAQDLALLEPAEEPVRVRAALSASPELPQRGWTLRFWIFAAALTVAVVLVAATAWFLAWRSSPLQSMWRPFFDSPDEGLIVVGSPLGALAGSAGNGTGAPLDSHSHVYLSLNDALALADVASLFKVHHRSYRVQTAGATSLDDLRKRPVVLIAAFGNPWSRRILAPLRFSLLRQQVAPDGSTILGSIVDRRHPDSMWNFDFATPLTVNSKDYAIVARLHSDLTEGPVAVIAGLGASATESAGEFLSSPEYLQQVNLIAPPSWRDKNLELVLEVPIVDGKASHAHIVASEFW